MTTRRLATILALATPMLAMAALYTDAPRVQARAELLWTRPICVETNRYIGWPTVCRLKNGDLLAVFSGDREAHICPWGKVQLVRSTDGGETWSAPETIGNGPIDDRDSGIVQMPDGEVIVSWFTSVAYRNRGRLVPDYPPSNPRYWWKRHDEKIGADVRQAALGNFCVRSRDNGRTWSKPERFTRLHNAPHGPNVLADGSLIHVGYHESPDGYPAPRGYSRLGAERSTDGGRTWELLCAKIAEKKSQVADDCPILDEPHTVQLPSGRILALIRVNDAWVPRKCMMQTHSDDGGRTWAPLTETPLLGLPPHLVSLGGDRVLCVYGRRLPDPGCGQFACISDDGGRTWDVAHEISLAPHTDYDLGYPSTAVLPDGTLVTVFYQPMVPKGMPCLMATKWRITK